MESRFEYWNNRYSKQGRNTVGHISFNKEQFKDKTEKAKLLLRQHILKNLDHRLKNVLDFGCGIGRMYKPLAIAAHKVYGIDIVPWAIEQAQEENIGGDFKVFDGENIPFDDEFFEAALSWTVLQHIPPDKIAGICKEIERVICDDGYLILYENVSIWYPDKPHIWFRSVYQYWDLFNKMGCSAFNMVKNADDNDEHHVLMLLRKEKG